MRPLDRWLFFSLTPLWLLALVLAALSLDRNEVVAPLRAAGAPDSGSFPSVTSLPSYTRVLSQPGGGLQVGDELLRIGDVDLRGASAARVIGVAWSEMDNAGAISLEVKRHGQPLEVGMRIPATVPKWPALLVSLAFGGMAVFSLLRFPSLRVMQVSFPALMAMALWTGSYFGRTPTELMAAFWLRAGSLAFLQPLTVRMIRHLPDGREGARWARGWPTLLGLNAVVWVDDTLSDVLPGWIQTVGLRLFALCGLLLFTAVGFDRYFASNRIGRRRFKWILLGVLLGGTPGAMVSLASAFRPELGAWFLPSQAAQLVIPPFLIIAITRHQLFDIDRLLNFSFVTIVALCLLAVAGLTAGPPARAWLVSRGLGELTANVSLAAVALALTLPVAIAVLRRLDAWTQREQREREAAVDALLDRISQAGKLREIGSLVTGQVAALWKARGAAAWVCTEGRPTPISIHGELPADWEGALEDARGDPPPGHLRLAVPASDRRSGAAGGILLGPARSGEPFEPRDRALLALVAERMGAALASLEQRELLAHARALNRELGEQHALAQRSSEEKSRMLATASHDLRQPLQALRLFLGALASRLEDPEQRDLVAKAQLSAIAMQQTFEALLDLTRLDAGVLEVRPEKVALGDVLVELRSFLEPLAAARGLTLELEPCALGVRSDPALLRSILQNLIGNAIRYTDEGRVSVSARPEGDAVVIEVADTGPGFAEDERAALFEPWRRGRSAAGNRDGAGLGLSIVSRLTALLGHALDVESEPGRGSRFRLSATACEPPRPAAPASGAVAQPLAGARVLVVDDDPAARQGLVALLEGWEVDVVSGPAVEPLLERCRQRPVDAALIDYALADASGLEALDALQAVCGELPCAIVTGETDPAVADAVRRRGLPLLRKPAAPVQVRAVLTSLVGPDASARRAQPNTSSA